MAARASLADRVEYWALRAMLGALRGLSWRRATAVGARVGTRAAQWRVSATTIATIPASTCATAPAAAT
jgi:hypothetical protein